MRRIIRKFAQNRQTNRQTHKQRIQKQRPPYPLWSVDRRGTRANNIDTDKQICKYWQIYWNYFLTITSNMYTINYIIMVPGWNLGVNNTLAPIFSISSSMIVLGDIKSSSLLNFWTSSSCNRPKISLLLPMVKLLSCYIQGVPQNCIHFVFTDLLATCADIR